MHNNLNTRKCWGRRQRRPQIDYTSKIYIYFKTSLDFCLNPFKIVKNFYKDISEII